MFDKYLERTWSVKKTTEGRLRIGALGIFVSLAAGGLRCNQEKDYIYSTGLDRMALGLGSAVIGAIPSQALLLSKTPPCGVVQAGAFGMLYVVNSIWHTIYKDVVKGGRW